MKIPLCKPYWGKEEEKAAVNAIRKTIGTGDGPNTVGLIEKLRKLTGARYVIPTTSCTHGMELAVAAMGVGPGDEVIVPSFTMSSTANAILISGGKPVFADIEPEYYSIDPEDIKIKITPKTRGIMVVHYAGMPAAMEKILAIARKHNLFVIEDAAHAIGVKYKGKMLGSWGDAGVYSFHGTKNACCGEGGTVLTSDKILADKMEIYRANGTNRKQFLEGIVDKYSWVGKGTSYFLSDILAAIMIPQVDKVSLISRKRTRIARKYLTAFSKFSDRIILPKVPDNTLPNWHIFAFRFRRPADRSVFIRQMRDRGIEVSYHYVPLHSAPMGVHLSDGKPVHLPVTDEVAGSLVRLPIYAGLKEKELNYIIRTACSIIRSPGK
jgi:dTDP-4-amino-4,6-dideoxygalactose transaminase